MVRRPPRSTRTDTLFPDTTLFRSPRHSCAPRWTASNIGMMRWFTLSPVHGCRGLPSPSRWMPRPMPRRSEEHTSELQSLMRISYAVFCLKKKNDNSHRTNTEHKYRHKYEYKQSYTA